MVSLSTHRFCGYFPGTRIVLSLLTREGSNLKSPFIIFSTSSPAIGSIASIDFLASAKKSESFKVVMRACLIICTGSFGVPGGIE